MVKELVKISNWRNVRPFGCPICRIGLSINITYDSLNIFSESQKKKILNITNVF